MSWNPENTEALANTLNVSTFEETITRLWFEFLKGYFDGGTHSGVIYPSSTFSFAQSRIPQPLSSLHIQVVTNVDGKLSQIWMANGLAVRTRMRWSFIVRSQTKYPELARRGADRLFYLLNHPTLLQPIQRAGLYGLRTQPAITVQSNDYAIRRLMVSAHADCLLDVPEDDAIDNSPILLDPAGNPIMDAAGNFIKLNA